MIKDLNSELGFEQSIKELSRRKSILMAFLTPRNLIFSSQNPNSTFHFRSQVKIGFLLLKFRFFTPRNLIFSSQNPKSKSDFIFSNFDFSLQEIWFFFVRRSLLIFWAFFTLKKSKSQVKIGFFFFSEPKFRFFTPRHLFFSSQNPNSTFHSRS